MYQEKKENKHFFSIHLDICDKLTNFAAETNKSLIECLCSIIISTIIFSAIESVSGLVCGHDIPMESIP